MCETTDSINLFVPMMIAILVSRAVSGIFTTSLYDRALRTKQMPVLKEMIPEATNHVKVKFLMQKEIKTIHSVASMKEIRESLATSHGAWPVLNIAGNLCGVMPRSILHKLVTQKAFYT
jgi:hypothetical protein